jgi:hypothetical protein
MKSRPQAIFVVRTGLLYDDGEVTDEHGNALGNIYDEI